MRLLTNGLMATCATIGCVAFAEVRITGEAWIVNGVAIDEAAAAYEQSSDSSLKAAVMKVACKLFSIGKPSRQRARGAVVRILSVPDERVLASGKADAEGRFELTIPEADYPLKVVSHLEVPKDGKTLRYDGVVTLSSQRVGCPIELKREHAVICGRCVYKDLKPASGKMVEVLQYPNTEITSLQDSSTMFTRTHANGNWRCDGLDVPSLNDAAVFLANTNMLKQQCFENSPLSVVISVYDDSEQESSSRKVETTMLTEKLKGACEKIMAAYARKTGKPYPKKAPMKDFPVSTNNVIYVPDIVLP